MIMDFRTSKYEPVTSALKSDHYFTQWFGFDYIVIDGCRLQGWFNLVIYIYDRAYRGCYWANRYTGHCLLFIAAVWWMHLHMTWFMCESSRLCDSVNYLVTAMVWFGDALFTVSTLFAFHSTRSTAVEMFRLGLCSVIFVLCHRRSRDKGVAAKRTLFRLVFACRTIYIGSILLPKTTGRWSWLSGEFSHCASN